MFSAVVHYCVFYSEIIALFLFITENISSVKPKRKIKRFEIDIFGLGEGGLRTLLFIFCYYFY